MYLLVCYQTFPHPEELINPVVFIYLFKKKKRFLSQDLYAFWNVVVKIFRVQFNLHLSPKLGQ